MFRRLVACSLALAAGVPSAVTLQVTHDYREFVDRGAFRMYVSADDASRLDCAAGLEHARFGNRIVLIARRVPGPRVEGDCISVSALVGTLPAGEYEVEARLTHVVGTGYDVTVQSLPVLPLEGRCNAAPELQPAIWGVPTRLPADEFVAKVAMDPAFAASLGNPVVAKWIYSPQRNGHYVTFTYPPLVDPTVMMARAHETGELAGLDRNGHLCYSPSPPDAVATMIEYYHAALDHYFYTADAGEIAAVDAGRVGSWTRTGKSFRVTVAPGCIGSTPETVVYRFSGVPGKGPSSHFFTRDRAECHAVERSAQWSLEGVPFYASAPTADGTCDMLPSVPPRARVPLHRLWRPFGDSNHRFAVDDSVVAEMKARGWVDEGVAMCVLPPA